MPLSSVGSVSPCSGEIRSASHVKAEASSLDPGMSRGDSWAPLRAVCFFPKLVVSTPEGSQGGSAQTWMFHFGLSEVGETSHPTFFRYQGVKLPLLGSLFHFHRCVWCEAAPEHRPALGLVPVRTRGSVPLLSITSEGVISSEQNVLPSENSTTRRNANRSNQNSSSWGFAGFR